MKRSPQTGKTPRKAAAMAAHDILALEVPQAARQARSGEGRGG